MIFKIILIGYMGSGKTTIGQKLANNLNHKFYDLDQKIIKYTKKSISELFEIYGEKKFRKLEFNILNFFFKTKKSYILSVGGGTPCYKHNMFLMKKNSKIIYLNAEINTLFTRILNQKENRPLISKLSNNDLYHFICDSLRKRFFFYKKADSTIYIENKSFLDIVKEIKYVL
ncbi:shikimate kinase [Candidatus Karelsulcia muelleri]|uniref:shikimate kinase n=1 Tax=Candidatus Karelsulcia muelleri TaxID=336810 RepID=UPI00216A49D4|nr:shikimate kinase [Candidatus Karelsulcia muelleri]